MWVGMLLLTCVVVLLIFAIVQDSNISSSCCEHCSCTNTSEQNCNRRSVQEMVPLNLGEFFLYEPDNSFSVQVEAIRLPLNCVHSSWHNLCPVHCNCVLTYFKEGRVKASHIQTLYLFFTVMVYFESC